MNNPLHESLWKQFGASMDMLENAITLCPDEHWNTEKNFWYIAYHSLFWLDYYLSVEPAGFTPPAPFTLSEFDPSGALPDRTYSREELLNYLHASREKCRQLLTSYQDELLTQRWINEYKNFSLFEMMLYNMRRVQHHTAQLITLLRKETGHAPGWVSQTRHNI